MDGTEAHDEVVPLHVEKVDPEQGATLPGSVQNIRASVLLENPVNSGHFKCQGSEKPCENLFTMIPYAQ